MNTDKLGHLGIIHNVLYILPMRNNNLKILIFPIILKVYTLYSTCILLQWPL